MYHQKPSTCVAPAVQSKKPRETIDWFGLTYAASSPPWAMQDVPYLSAYRGKGLTGSSQITI